MTTYVVLLRGVNVGGNNPVPMAQLRTDLTAAGFANVRTYIASGNIVLDSQLSAAQVRGAAEKLVGVPALVLSAGELGAVIDQAPDGFGGEPDTFHYDVAFYLDTAAALVEPHIRLNPDVDFAHAGPHALYYRRLSALRTKSRLSTIASSPIYRNLTIRNWRTTTKLLEMTTQ